MSKRPMPLEDIGFCTLSDERAVQASDCSPMKRCELIVTEACNFRCPYCRGLDKSVYGARPKRQLSFLGGRSEVGVRDILDAWCADGGLENVRFSGGEPTLHPQIKLFVDYARQKGVRRIALSTNGSSPLDLYRQLISFGVNDLSISLDACCAADGDKMAGSVAGSFDKVVETIRECSKLTYVTAGVVLTPENAHRAVETVEFASSLGVADVRIISAAQWNGPLPALREIRQETLDRHPILRYRVGRLLAGQNVRGIAADDSHRCGLVLDDSIVAGDYHFPCVVYMREKGRPIGKVGPAMREERKAWHDTHNSMRDPICQKNCLDICIAYNNRWAKAHPAEQLSVRRRLPILNEEVP